MEDETDSPGLKQRVSKTRGGKREVTRNMRPGSDESVLLYRDRLTNQAKSNNIASLNDTMPRPATTPWRQEFEDINCISMNDHSNTMVSHQKQNLFTIDTGNSRAAQAMRQQTQESGFIGTQESCKTDPEALAILPAELPTNIRPDERGSSQLPNVAANNPREKALTSIGVRSHP